MGYIWNCDFILNLDETTTSNHGSINEEENKSKPQGKKTVRHVEELLTSDTPDKERPSLLRLTLKEKFETIKALDSEVVDLIEGEESAVADEIEQADGYKETILACLVNVRGSRHHTSHSFSSCAKCKPFSTS